MLNPTNSACSAAIRQITLTALIILLASSLSTVRAAETPIDFNRQIRPILSNNCFRCHGPDAKNREADLRLDTEAGALAKIDGSHAIVRGKPDESALIEKIRSDDPDERMPPSDSGNKLTSDEIKLLTKWVKQGAPYSRHWSYVKPALSRLPAVAHKAWPNNAIDHFLLVRLELAGLAPSAEASRGALIRRVSLDLTGLPPSPEEVAHFVTDKDPQAYEKLVDRLLAKRAYGEHWAQMWLDLARYADSAGYADDPPRTIWAFRDYVIRSFNANKRFDQFTIEQIAGDLLENPTLEQLTATAFHRNTLTNSEGGTDDEEFRNVAVVDRVNTTMAVWMGTTMACAQCHSHKYDPISQEEFFRFFAILNNTEDADRKNESPLVSVLIEEQRRKKIELQAEIVRIESSLKKTSPELAKAEAQWASNFRVATNWKIRKPDVILSKSGAAMTLADDGSIRVARGGATDVYTFEMPVEPGTIRAVRLETLPDDSLPSKGPGHAGGNFVVSHVQAAALQPSNTRPTARYVRIYLPGKQKILSLAEVQVFSGEANIARKGEASHSSTASDGPAKLAVDGNTDGRYQAAKSTTHTAISENPWWEVDLKSAQPINRIVLWNRTDNNQHTRLVNFRITLLDDKRKPVWSQQVAASPNPTASYWLGGRRTIEFSSAIATFAQSGFPAAAVLDGKTPNKGWAISPQLGKSHTLTLVLKNPVEVPAGAKLSLTIGQLSKYPHATLGRLRISTTNDYTVEATNVPPQILAIVKTASVNRTVSQKRELTKYFQTIAPQLKPLRDHLAILKSQFAAIVSATTVPVMRELPANKQRKTYIQLRGNFLVKDKLVTAGVPGAFHPLPEGAVPNRLGLARWLVDAENPLTPRVIVNRYWEAIFGIGIVRTSEDFGSQGELPSHQQLLDYLAADLVQNGWDIKRLLKQLVTSAAYRQSSKVTPALYERDPDNRLLARGPRFRLSAEMIRDQALSVSGLLSSKMYGPPVRPPQPNLGLAAAFGSSTDWKPSAGEDRYRRALYTSWRRSNPYPSMAAFDAPNREVCTIRRDRTNTPLQALVTLNDPVYMEAAQSLARRTEAAGGSTVDRARYIFRVCLAREPTDQEFKQLVDLFEVAYAKFKVDTNDATSIATKPLGPPPKGADVAALAAWTLVGNVMLNLDEMLMKR